jgi:hypothetical protein
VSNTPFTKFNKEIIFFCSPPRPDILSLSRAKIDNNLYQSYHTDDLRRKLFFRTNFGSNAGTFGFQGSYQGITASNLFDGITTGEIYLIKAECEARVGNVAKAMSDLNALMIKRWNNQVPYPEISANNSTEALNKVLTERRKELIYRGLRWSDLRRFNLEGANTTLTRVLNNQTYSLPPNDPRWVALIPLEVITRSGISQNKR